MNALGYRIVYRIARIVPPAWLMRAATRAADLAWRAQPAMRRIVTDNLAQLIGPGAGAGLPSGREVFRHFSRYLVETFTMDRWREPQITVEGLEHLLAAKESGRGMIALTAHLGNWELGAVALRRFGVPMAAVALPHGSRALDRIFTRQRARCGIRTIPLGPRAAQQSLAYLREGCWIGLLGDLDVTGDALTGRLGWATMLVPRGPAVLSLRARVPVIPMALLRTGDRAFRLVIEPPIEPGATIVSEGSVRVLTDRLTAALTRLLLRAPEQWLVFEPIAVSGEGAEPRPGPQVPEQHSA